jgi:hypothetical protein
LPNGLSETAIRLGDLEAYLVLAVQKFGSALDDVDEALDDVDVVRAVRVYRVALIIDVAYCVAVKEYCRKPVRLVVSGGDKVLQRWILETSARRNIEENGTQANTPAVAINTT